MVAPVVGSARVPSALPRILKDYTKAAIRTQPRDLLTWSSAYFKALTQGSALPVKDRLEFPVPESESGVSPGVLRVLHRQLSGGVEWGQLSEACGAMGVGEGSAREAWRRAGGGEDGTVDWDHILTHLAALSTHSELEALQLIMAAVSGDPVSLRVSGGSVMDHYHRLHTHTNIVPTDHYHEVVAYLQDIANYQDGDLTPADLARPSCPLVN